MATKDWELPKKQNRKEHRMYVNKNPKYQTFDTRYYLTVGREGRSDSFFVDVTKSGKQILSRSSYRNNGFKTYKQALSYAKKYMRSN